MRTFVFPVLAGLLASTALATVSIQVYRADEQTPLEWADPNIPGVYQDIMVGTSLTLFVVAENPASDWWSGGLWVSRDNWTRGTISGRGLNDEIRGSYGEILPAVYEDSILVYKDSIHVPLAEEKSSAFEMMDSGEAVTFGLFVDPAVAGEWFVLDYHAETLGICDVGLYASEMVGEFPPGFDESDLISYEPPFENVWIQALSFNHVPTRDFDGDSVVNFEDFALWANQWQETIATDPNTAVAEPNATIPGDLNADAAINAADLAQFCDFWLDRTDLPGPALEPNLPNDAL